ncbi:hatching enzyme 1.2-like isoform X1 [Ambystoma mexicanum]|uniref:hatching enzyme 1.2-like isoform X1 n=1 Tax=Ambystoma mexicanum TaxID=8296 RepID=UPI0037E9C77F
MKLLLLSVLLSALPATLYAVPLRERAGQVHTWRLRQGWLAGPLETQHHLDPVLIGGEPDEQADLDSVEEDPEPSAQILKVNQASGESPIGRPPLEFGDIAVNPLGNADQCASDRCRWPRAANGQVLVPYEISSSYTSNERDVIMAAIQSFSPSTCISFKPRTDETDYLFIEPQTGCWSLIGRTGGRQVVSLQQKGCLFLGTAQHELLHALGFHHEQNRGDRDDFVDILLQNVIPGMERDFRKVNTNNLGTRYDYASIMHYSKNTFSRNGRPTIVPKPDPNVAIGTSRQFTSTDINKINLLYCSN